MVFFRKLCRCALLLFLCCGVNSGQQPISPSSPSSLPAQKPDVRKNSVEINENSAGSDEAPFQTRQISEWVGERFIFMPRQPSLGKYGYLLIYRVNKIAEEIAYEEYVGKIVKVSAVAPGKYGTKGVRQVYLQIEGKDEKLFADAFDETIDGLAYLRDIEDARAKYSGKTLRLKEQRLGNHNAVADKLEYFTVPKNTLVKVVEIVAGWNQKAPVRFVVETPQKKKGFVDVNMSGTNIAEPYKKDNQFNDKFALVD